MDVLEKNRAISETAVMSGKKRGPDCIYLFPYSARQKLVIFVNFGAELLKVGYGGS